MASDLNIDLRYKNPFASPHNIFQRLEKEIRYLIKCKV